MARADAVDYYVQTKRNKPGTTIPIEKVRALRGVMPSGSKNAMDVLKDSLYWESNTLNLFAAWERDYLDRVRIVDY